MKEGREEPLEELLQQHLVVLQPALLADPLEPGGEDLTPGQPGLAARQSTITPGRSGETGGDAAVKR